MLINNAVTTAPDCQENVLKADPDAMAPAFNVGAVGPLRVIQACYPLLKKSKAALIVYDLNKKPMTGREENGGIFRKTGRDRSAGQI